MNPAPASTSDLVLFRKSYAQMLGPDFSRQQQIVASAAYKEGDPEAVTARYRLHFKPALMRREDYEKLMERMHAAFVSQGRDGIVEARAVEDRLMRDTWGQPGYDLLPKLRVLKFHLQDHGDQLFGRSFRSGATPRPTREQQSIFAPDQRAVKSQQCRGPDGDRNVQKATRAQHGAPRSR